MAYQQALPQHLWETVEAMKGVFTAGQYGSGVNSDQIEFIAKTFGIGTGF